MRHPELIQPRTLPALPRLSRVARRPLRVPLQHDDLMTVTGQQHRGPQRYYAGPHHHDPCHSRMLDPHTPRRQYSPAQEVPTATLILRASQRLTDDTDRRCS